MSHIHSNSIGLEKTILIALDTKQNNFDIQSQYTKPTLMSKSVADLKNAK
jgi:hypothetical protein